MMLLGKKYVKKGQTRHFLCLVLVFFLLFQSNSHLQNINFVIKITEKKEENRTEKESEDEKCEEQNKVGKLKKIKRQQVQQSNFVGDLPSAPNSPFLFVCLFYKINYLGYFPKIPNLFAGLARYLRFHSLVLYEKNEYFFRIKKLC